MARIDYHLHPDLWQGWGGAFNGQCGRQQIFIDLLAAFSFTHIVETGTYCGTSTEFLAREGKVPVFTVEADPKAHQFARLRLRRYPEVQLFAGDSRSFLRQVTSSVLVPTSLPFFYLDAHWEEDLPLLEEVEIVLRTCTQCVIMIDDFEVPGDRGYRFDDYGESKALTREYLSSVIEALRPVVAYPLLPSSRESGAKRGCIVLASSALTERLLKVPSLRLEVPTA